MSAEYFLSDECCLCDVEDDGDEKTFCHIPENWKDRFLGMSSSLEKLINSLGKTQPMHVAIYKMGRSQKMMEDFVRLPL